MRLKPQLSDYELLAKPRSRGNACTAKSDIEDCADLGPGKSVRASEEESTTDRITKNLFRRPDLGSSDDTKAGHTAPASTERVKPGALATGAVSNQTRTDETVKQKPCNNNWKLRRGHASTYSALFLFTIILYARPAEFYPSPLTASIALIVGVVTLAVFVPSQLSLEGTLTARPAEVNLVLLLAAPVFSPATMELEWQMVSSTVSQDG